MLLSLHTYHSIPYIHTIRDYADPACLACPACPTLPYAPESLYTHVNVPNRFKTLRNVARHLQTLPKRSQPFPNAPKTFPNTPNILLCLCLLTYHTYIWDYAAQSPSPAKRSHTIQKRSKRNQTVPKRFKPLPNAHKRSHVSFCLCLLTHHTIPYHTIL